VTGLIDCDMHLFEPPNMWQQYCRPAERDRVLRMETDELGYVWLVSGADGRRLTLAEPHQPKHPSVIGDYRQRQLQGLPSDLDYAAFSAPYSDPAAILAHLDRSGFGQAVLFPNYGIVWERRLASDLPTTLANMGAWNRWLADLLPGCAGRLHPVAHVSLRDRDWLLGELAELAGAGIRLALIPPALVDGRPLSDPSLDWVWSAFVDHQVTPVFHVADQPRPFDEAWYGEDTPGAIAPLTSIFIWTAAALALTDLIINGVLERHPDLRLGVMELSAIWVPLHLQMMDGGFAFAASFNGEKVPLSLRPSDYFRRQVRVAAFSYEQPRRLIDHAGDIFMACSDYPHTEGTDTALADYRSTGLEPEAAAGLFRENAEFLLRT
jgi:predicted TIM-barrel fold metal-dependent hydrolase